MKIAFSADVHIGNHRQYGGPIEAGINTRCQQVLDVLDASIKEAIEQGCSEFWVAGDLFDIDNPSPQLIKKVQDIFSHNILINLLLGNHEMTSAAPFDNALWSLQDRSRVFDCSGTMQRDGHNIIYVPYQPGPADEWLPQQLESLVSNDLASVEEKTLILHLGIKDGDTPPFLMNSHDSIHVDLLETLCRQHKINRVFTGNWHDHAVWSVGDKSYPIDINQIGTLCPTGWDNPGLSGYGKLAILDTREGTTTFKEIPGPRFIKCLALDGSQSKPWSSCVTSLRASKKAGNINYLRVKVSPAHFKECKESLDALKTKRIIQDGKVLVEETEFKVAAAEAASAAKSAVTLKSSIEKYIHKMSLPEGVSRKSVLQRVKKYMQT